MRIAIVHKLIFSPDILTIYVSGNRVAASTCQRGQPWNFLCL